MDIKIKNGTIIDGSGSPGFKGDLGIESDRIIAVGDCDGEAERTIDATGLVISPGFIDMHSHSDFSIFSSPQAKSMISQGVTTEVIGNCGLTAAPVTEKRIDSLKKYLGPLSASGNFDWSWRTFSDFLSLFDEGIAINIVPLVGQGAIRLAIMGSSSKKPTESEMDEMKNLLRESIEGGAFGLSTGLIYPPGIFTDTDELVELAKVANEYGCIYTTHIRNEGEGVVESVKEAIEIGKRSGISVEISHHKVTGKPNWGAVNETLKLIDEARAEGLNVNCDQYPYTASSTFLSSTIPNWVHEGGIFKMIKRLKDDEIRKRLIREINEGISGWENPIKDSGWENIVLSMLFSKKYKDLEGMSIAKIAELQGKEPFDALFDLLIKEPNAMVVLFEMCEADVINIIKHPATMIGSDGLAIPAEGKFAMVKLHPRSYGTFPRVLGKYVREDRVLSLEDAVMKMTSLAANKLGLSGRGLLKEGYFADITIFDPENIIDKATYVDPHRYSEGIVYVIVNGEVALEDCEQNEILAGRVLKRN